MGHHHGSDTHTSARAILHHTDQNGLNILTGSVSTYFSYQSKKRTSHIFHPKLFLSYKQQFFFSTNTFQKRSQNKFVHSFFGRIYCTPICFWFFLTFSIDMRLFWKQPVHCASRIDDYHCQFGGYHASWKMTAINHWF